MSNFTYTSNQLSTIDNSIRSQSDVNEHNRINSFFEYLKNLNTKRNISEKKLKLDNKKENLKKNFVRSNSNIFENSLYTLNNSCEQRNKFMNNETDKISLIINYLNRENNFLIDYSSKVCVLIVLVEVSTFQYHSIICLMFPAIVLFCHLNHH